jgi:hypothetical protein
VQHRRGAESKLALVVLGFAGRRAVWQVHPGFLQTRSAIVGWRLRQRSHRRRDPTAPRQGTCRSEMKRRQARRQVVQIVAAGKAAQRFNDDPVADTIGCSAPRHHTGHATRLQLRSRCSVIDSWRAWMPDRGPSAASGNVCFVRAHPPQPGIRVCACRPEPLFSWR